MKIKLGGPKLVLFPKNVGPKKRFSPKKVCPEKMLVKINVLNIGGRVVAGWLGGWFSDYIATSWPILQAEASYIFSQAELFRWTKCGNRICQALICTELFLAKSAK